MTTLRLALLVFLVACADEPEPVEGPCPLSDTPELGFAMRTAVYEHTDGEDFWFGHPPQGGAPFAPFLLRVDGLDSQPDGYQITLTGTDLTTDEVVGTGDYQQRFICANVGDNAGMRVAPELHMRFFGSELGDLEGREVRLDVELDDLAGTVLFAQTNAVLVRELTPE